ncbi:MAG: 23S rRNA (adenine(2503)-C(2))-methyltransferase RlmN [Clostridia bacterium]|nr:23S rRNA (adenine(2503)-C(2))-methyltransferase RlmN [Clostridia bacterium]
MEKKELLGLFPEELEADLKALGLPAFRAKQVFAWLHRGARFEEMTNLSKDLRAQLSGRSIDQPVSILEKRVSKLDGTVKLLYALPDGNCVEGVLMHYHHGHTLCLSTQVGCRMGCAFCASTLNGCVRSLTAAEMLGQVHCGNSLLGEEHVSNIVLMGSGEPLDNYENVTRFLRLVSHEQGLNLGLRHISLATCGLVPQLRRFAQEGLPVTLSLSLHAPNDAIRKKLMPVANAYTIEETLDACRYYIEQTGRRVVIEYALAAEINSLPEHARELASRLRGMQCHVNVIPLNTVAEKPLRGVDEATVSRFMQELERLHISVTRRREMGDDIDGACGQLRRHYLEGK